MTRIDWPEQDPPIRLRTRLLASAGFVALLLALALAGGGR